MALEVGIRAVGSYLPGRVLTNEELARRVDASDAWIVERTGIRERRVVGPGETAATMACAAAARAMEGGGVAGPELAFVVNSTSSPDLACPTVAARVGAAVGLAGGFCFDLNAACSGLVYALAVGASLLRTRGGGHGLVTASEQMTGYVDPGDRVASALFGDGACAALLSTAPPHHRIVHAQLGAEPAGAEAMSMGGQEAFGTAGRRFFRQDGRRVFRFGVQVLEAQVRAGLRAAGDPPPERVHVVPHQTNLRLLRTVAGRLGLAEERLVTNVQTHGNSSSASIGVALDEAARAGRFSPGDTVLLAAFGGGLTFGLVVLEW